MTSVSSAQARAGRGLVGDRYKTLNGKRQLTLIQWEHLDLIAANLALDAVDPAQLRRNLAVSGIDLLALAGRQFYVGNVLLEYTGLCQPCSAMDTIFGAGGYRAVIGYGGITTRILNDGIMRLGDKVYLANVDNRPLTH